MVDVLVMEDIKEKTPVIHFNGKTFQFPSKVPVPKSGTVHRPSAKATPKSPDQMLRTPASVISSLQGTPVKNQQSEETIRAPKCHCNKTATQLIVKKEGPTQGRLFWKCTERLCQFFEWDQEEVKHLQRKALQEKEDEEMRQAEMEARAEREMMVQQTMAAAEERHLSLMQEERSRHQQEMEYMKNQMFWLSAIAGEERMGEVYNNPMLQQETMLRAVQLRQKMMEEELAAAQNDPGASSSM